MTEDTLIEAIVKIGNHPDLMKRLEPNLMWHRKLEPWMVLRILVVLELLANEDRISEDTGGSVSASSVHCEGTIHGDP